MKESISYTFLLNIIITFIFICFAVIMGIFSYYRAFRANTAILNAIEKYEGFNCLSIAEIDKQLKNIGYNVPFKANNKNGTEGILITNTNREKNAGYSINNDDVLSAIIPGTNKEINYGNLGYSVIYFDHSSDDKLSSITFSSGESRVKEYQYGVYTYMYLDLPVINGILKIPVFGKTSKLYEFRNQDVMNSKYTGDMNLYTGSSRAITETLIQQYATAAGTSFQNVYLDPRLYFKFDIDGNGKINMNDLTVLLNNGDRSCGTFIDYSVYGGTE